MTLDWLLMSIDASRPHDISTAVSWHARMMVAAWGVLIPTGIVIARYFKILPWQDWPRELDNRFWWISHLWLQQLGFGLTVVATCIAVFAIAQKDGASVHVLLGWAVVVLACLQVVSGWLRGTKGGPGLNDANGNPTGDHYTMSGRRVAFEVFHKSCGTFLLLAGAANIAIGLWIVNAPVWMWVTLPAYWTLLLLVCIWGVRKGTNIGSYKAIWGPDNVHPGNQ